MAQHAETADSLSLAMLVSLESLSRGQRAMLLRSTLRIRRSFRSSIVGKSEDTVRLEELFAQTPPVPMPSADLLTGVSPES